MVPAWCLCNTGFTATPWDCILCRAALSRPPDQQAPVVKCKPRQNVDNVQVLNSSALKINVILSDRIVSHPCLVTWPVQYTLSRSTLMHYRYLVYILMTHRKQTVTVFIRKRFCGVLQWPHWNSTRKSINWLFHKNVNHTQNVKVQTQFASFFFVHMTAHVTCVKYHYPDTKGLDISLTAAVVVWLVSQIATWYSPRNICTSNNNSYLFLFFFYTI